MNNPPTYEQVELEYLESLKRDAATLARVKDWLSREKLEIRAEMKEVAGKNSAYYRVLNAFLTQTVLVIEEIETKE